MSNWKPIETAPKDGTWVLLAGGDIEYGWDYEQQKPSMVVAQWAQEGMGDRCQWQFAWYDSGCYGEYIKPTHWMPLPEPPPNVREGE